MYRLSYYQHVFNKHYFNKKNVISSLPGLNSTLLLYLSPLAHRVCWGTRPLTLLGSELETCLRTSQPSQPTRIETKCGKALHDRVKLVHLVKFSTHCFIFFTLMTLSFKAPFTPVIQKCRLTLSPSTRFCMNHLFRQSSVIDFLQVYELSQKSAHLFWFSNSEAWFYLSSSNISYLIRSVFFIRSHAQRLNSLQRGRNIFPFIQTSLSIHAQGFTPPHALKLHPTPFIPHSHSSPPVSPPPHWTPWEPRYLKHHFSQRLSILLTVIMSNLRIVLLASVSYIRYENSLLEEPNGSVVKLTANNVLAY